MKCRFLGREGSRWVDHLGGGGAVRVRVNVSAWQHLIQSVSILGTINTVFEWMGLECRSLSFQISHGIKPLLILKNLKVLGCFSIR